MKIILLILLLTCLISKAEEKDKKITSIIEMISRGKKDETVKIDRFVDGWIRVQKVIFTPATTITFSYSLKLTNKAPESEDIKMVSIYIKDSENFVTIGKLTISDQPAFTAETVSLKTGFATKLYTEGDQIGPLRMGNDYAVEYQTLFTESIEKIHKHLKHEEE